MVSHSLQRGEQIGSIGLQRAKTFRDRANEVITKYGLSTSELKSMNETIARYSQVSGDETRTSNPAQDVSKLLLRKLFDQHVLLSELALDRNNVHEAEWYEEQASELADRYALKSAASASAQTRDHVRESRAGT